MAVLVTFVYAPDATSYSKDTAPLLNISLAAIPRIGDAVRLPVKHSPETAEYRVCDVLHVIVPLDTEGHEVIVAVQ